MNTQLETVHNGKMTKVDRYKWSVSDSPGKFMMISKHKLEVDHDYQRRAIDSKVKKIASEWSWIGCGAIIVGERAFGELFVMDGQHRVCAAMLRSDISELPCLVFEVASMKEEAHGFYRSNVNRKPLTFIAKFNALLISGDADCLKAKESIDKAGYSIVEAASADKTIACISSVVESINEDTGAFNRAWPVIVAVHNGKAIHKDIVRGLFYIERRSDISISEKSIRDKLISSGKDELLQAIRKSQVFFGSMNPRSAAEGLLSLINKSRKKKITLTKPAKEQ